MSVGVSFAVCGQGNRGRIVGPSKCGEEIIATMAHDKRKISAPAKEFVEALKRERKLLKERSDTLRFEFVVSELDLAITFCHSAAATRDPERSRRNRERAEEAYSTARRFLGSERVSEPMRRMIQEKTSALEELLHELGQKALRDQKTTA